MRYDGVCVRVALHTTLCKQYAHYHELHGQDSLARQGVFAVEPQPTGRVAKAVQRVVQRCKNRWQGPITGQEAMQRRDSSDDVTAGKQGLGR